jgi:hypothetical protein
MSTVELRHVISEHLAHIDDAPFLNALKNILESKISNGVYILSDFQKLRIESARNEFKNGQTISNEELQAEIDQWLNSK